MKAIPFAGIGAWLNSKPLEISMLKGKVVLLDFWTYSCINCVRSVPHMISLWNNYKSYPFVLIGVHTPEFYFEKSKENVTKAVKKMKIDYPIALDSENITWKLYGNRYWPKQVLISAEGDIVYGHIGEGGYIDIEKNIVEQLKAIGIDPKPNAQAAAAPPEGFRVAKKSGGFWDIFRFKKHAEISPESYAGRGKGSIASQITRCDGSINVYELPEKCEKNRIYLNGEWFLEREYVVHNPGKTGNIFYRFTGRSVNVVIDSEKEIECIVTVDGKPLTKYNMGRDIIFDKEASKIIVDRPDVYNLFSSEEVEHHQIRIDTEGELKLFAFSFG